ncbi:uncharacterized protein DNG_00073 [Cephalotrichum gorgonifer]|uniref:Uncharacterized protein n=1 Tax=Cephalotrichum gorgonifer TaxID=2041049 RepID=A0AAE8MPB8_9PEZI|nr:uncharacterized protein DNG_00073 [Cephalotrichum gorgonifer]
MDTKKKIHPKFAEALKSSEAGYEAERQGDYKEALDAHNRAVERLTPLTKSGGFFSILSQEKRLLRQEAETKIGLHLERMRALQPYQGEKKSETPLVPAVTDFTVANALGSPSPAPSAMLEFSKRLNNTGPHLLSCLEIELPDRDITTYTPPSFTNTLPPDASVETWVVRRRGNTDASLEGRYHFTIKDATETNTLYFLDAPIQFHCHIPFAWLIRAGDYPHAGALIKTWEPTMPMHAMETRLQHRARKMEIENSLLQAGIHEEPDRKDTSPWGPRRFFYGCHKFVWKPKHPDKGHEDGNFETLYEFSRYWPDPDRKGRLLDDADESKPLFWCDDVPGFMLEFKWTVHFRGGLDPVFKEHLIASQVAKMAVMHANSKFRM